MTLAQLIARFRTDANDKAVPYFWSDLEVTAWLNEAEAEAALRGRLIHESDILEICEIDVVPGQTVYALHPSIYELSYVAFKLDPSDTRRQKVWLTSTEELDANVRDWRDATPATLRSIYGIQGDNTLRIAPKPEQTGVLYLEGYRFPLEPMVQNTDSPEINEAHHVHLVQWALHKAFSIPDTEAFDASRSALAETEFTRYFGVRPDSDLRRITREDTPHHVEAFWP